jgi:hypothetical protein
MQLINMIKIDDCNSSIYAGSLKMVSILVPDAGIRYHRDSFIFKQIIT